MALIISSLNVNGIKERPKRSKVFSLLRAEHCDIYLLHETHVQSVQEGKLWESEWGGQAIFSPGSNRSAGVGILINPRSLVAILTHKADKSGHLISAKLKHNNSKFQIFNVYAPNTGQTGRLSLPLFGSTHFATCRSLWVVISTVYLVYRGISLEVMTLLATKASLNSILLPIPTH